MLLAQRRARLTCSCCCAHLLLRSEGSSSHAHAAPPTEQDREARIMAAERVRPVICVPAVCVHALAVNPRCRRRYRVRCMLPPQAEARQRQFEQSAVGRATLKAVKEAKKPEPRPNGGSNAQDWLS